MEGGKEFTKIDTAEKWAYPYFKEYMLALTRGSDFLLPFDRYPKRIELSSPWHELLDQMRRESRDGTERWALVGFKDDQRSLYLPRTLTKGSSHGVSVEIRVKAIEQAKTKAGITSLVGDIHSHPNGWFRRLERLQNPLYAPFKGNVQGFSIGDLFGLKFKPFIGLSEVDRNLFAFKSRETDTNPADALESNYNEFNRYWSNKFGIKVATIKNFPLAIPTKPTSILYNTWSANKMIAGRYKIVLYQGFPGKDLVRVLPK